MMFELGCGGALAKHARKGDKVYAYVTTVSGFTGYNKQVIRTNEDALREGEKSMAILGVQLICGRFNTFEVEFSDELNIEIGKVVEEKK